MGTLVMSGCTKGTPLHWVGSYSVDSEFDCRKLNSMVLDNLQIECPDCSKIIDINEQISHHLKEGMDDERKQIESKIKRDMESSHLKEVQKFKAQLTEKDKMLLSKEDEDDKKELELQKLKHQIETNEKRIEMEREKAALEAKKAALEEYEVMAEELAKQKNAASEQENLKLQMKINELLDRERQTNELHKEALRKAAQGSVQTQGEGGEIFIEDLVGQAFQSDIISEVPKGTKGADVIQSVRFGSGIEAGLIIWEVKRTKQWSNKWISKVKEDTVRANGHISVIVSEAMPSGVSGMTMIEDNVWVCKFNEVQGLATALRSGLIRAETAVKSQEGKGSKMELLYNYMSGQEFANAMRLIDDSYIAELDIIEKERRSMERNWSSRRKAAEARLRGFSEFFGTVKQIATELPVIQQIEMGDQNFLPAPEDELL